MQHKVKPEEEALKQAAKEASDRLHEALHRLKTTLRIDELQHKSTSDSAPNEHE